MSNTQSHAHGHASESKMSKEQIVEGLQAQHHKVDEYAAFIKQQIEHDIPAIIAQMSEEDAAEGNNPEQAAEIQRLNEELERLRNQVNHDDQAVDRNDGQIHQDFENLQQTLRQIMAQRQVIPGMIEQAKAAIEVVDGGLQHLSELYTNKAAEYRRMIDLYVADSNKVSELMELVQQAKDSNEHHDAVQLRNRLNEIDGADEKNFEALLNELHQLDKIDDMLVKLNEDLTMNDQQEEAEIHNMRNEFKVVDRLSKLLMEAESKIKQAGTEHENEGVRVGLIEAKVGIEFVGKELERLNRDIYRDVRMDVRDALNAHVVLKREHNAHKDLFAAAKGTFKTTDRKVEDANRKINKGVLSRFNVQLGEEARQISNIKSKIEKLENPLQILSQRTLQIMTKTQELNGKLTEIHDILEVEPA